MSNAVASHAVTPSATADNGNADFWSAHPAADLVGGVATSTETGLLIKGGTLYDFTWQSYSTADITVKKCEDEDGTFFTVIAHTEVPAGELLYQEVDTMTEALDVIAFYAPAPNYIDRWNASEFAIRGDEAEVWSNALVIENFDWHNTGVNLTQLSIYTHLTPSNHKWADNKNNHYFSVYRTADRMLQEGDQLDFATFNDVLVWLRTFVQYEDVTAENIPTDVYWAGSNPEDIYWA